MTSAKTSRYPGLDLLRSVAILLVIMQHMPRTLFPEWFMQCHIENHLTSTIEQTFLIEAPGAV